MSKSKYFSQKDLSPASDFKLAHVEADGTVYSSTVLQRKTTLGLFERWVEVADLMDPLRDNDKEIESAKNKVKELEAKKEVLIREAKTIMASMPNVTNGGKRYSLGKVSNAKPVKDFFPAEEEEKKDKPKTTSVILHGNRATPESKQNNGRKN